MISNAAEAVESVSFATKLFWLLAAEGSRRQPLRLPKGPAGGAAGSRAVIASLRCKRFFEQRINEVSLLSRVPQGAWPRRLVFGKLYCLVYLSHLRSWWHGVWVAQTLVLSAAALPVSTQTRADLPATMGTCDGIARRILGKGPLCCECWYLVHVWV